MGSTNQRNMAADCKGDMVRRQGAWRLALGVWRWAFGLSVGRSAFFGSGPAATFFGSGDCPVRLLALPGKNARPKRIVGHDHKPQSPHRCPLERDGDWTKAEEEGKGREDRNKKLGASGC